MDKMFFLRHYGILLSAKSVLIDTDVAELTYQAYRDDFTDEEFTAAKRCVASDLRSLTDSQGELEGFYLAQVLDGLDYGPMELA